MSGVNVATTSKSTSAGSRAGSFQASRGRVHAKVARRLVRKSESALVDAGAIDDPFRVKAVALAQVVIADDELGQIASSTQDAHAQKCAGRRPEMDLAVVHEQVDYNECFVRTLYQRASES